jgi:hypothetical protein
MKHDIAARINEIAYEVRAVVLNHKLDNSQKAGYLRLLAIKINGIANELESEGD